MLPMALLPRSASHVLHVQYASDASDEELDKVAPLVLKQINVTAIRANGGKFHALVPSAACEVTRIFL